MSPKKKASGSTTASKPTASASATVRATVNRGNLRVWLDGADVTDPATVSKLDAMMRTAEGNPGDDTKHKVTAILAAIQANAANLDDIGPRRLLGYTRNVLVMSAHVDMAQRLTEAACAMIARALTAPWAAHRRGVPRGQPGVAGKHATIAQALAEVLGKDVSEATVKKSLPR